MNSDSNNESLNIGHKSKSNNIKEAFFWVSIFIAMVAGMIAKALYDYTIYNREINFSLMKLITPDVYIPILISPIVFGGIYGIIQTTPKNIGTFIFTFQNGFFWKTLFSKAEGMGFEQ